MKIFQIYLSEGIIIFYQVAIAILKLCELDLLSDFDQFFVVINENIKEKYSDKIDKNLEKLCKSQKIDKGLIASIETFYMLEKSQAINDTEFEKDVESIERPDVSKKITPLKKS